MSANNQPKRYAGLLRRWVYGIDYHDLSLAERARWSYAAASVVIATAFSAVGIWHFGMLATETPWIAVSAAVVSAIGIFQFDRVITAPEPNFAGLDIEGFEAPQREPAWKPWVRIPFSILIIFIGGVGLALLLNAASVERRVDRQIQTDELHKMQDRAATYFGAVVAERNAALGSYCRALTSNRADDRKLANLARQQVTTLNRAALGPAIDAFAGSHALDTLVSASQTPTQQRQQVTGSLHGCPLAFQLAGEDPLETVYHQRFGSGQATDGTVELVAFPPDLDDVIAYHREVQGMADDAKAAKDKATEEVDDPYTGDADNPLAKLQPMVRQAAVVTALEQQTTLDRMEMFSARWEGSLRESLDAPHPVESVKALQYDWGLLVICWLLVAFFDLSPWFMATFLRPRDGRETLEQRMARHEATSSLFRDRIDADAARHIREAPVSEDHRAAVTQELERVGGSFREGDVPPDAHRGDGLTTHDPNDITRRAVVVGGATAAVAASLGTAAWIRNTFFVTEAAPIGMALLREVAETFGMSVALELLSDLSGITIDGVVHSIFGTEMQADSLDSTYRPSIGSTLAFAGTDGTMLVGVGSRNEQTCYPGFLPASPFQGAPSAEELILVAPHWLDVIAIASSDLATDPRIGGPTAGRALLPTRWTGGDQNVPAGGASQRIYGTWDTALGSVQALLDITDSGRPPAGLDRGDGLVTTATARGTLVVRPRPASDVAQPTGLERKIDLGDIPVPTLWT